MVHKLELRQQFSDVLRNSLILYTDPIQRISHT